MSKPDTNQIQIYEELSAKSKKTKNELLLTLRLSLALPCAMSPFCARQCQHIRQRHTQRTPYIRILGDWLKNIFRHVKDTTANNEIP